MSFLAFDLDALKMVPDAARSAGIDEASMGYGLVRMWSYCWTVKRECVTEAHLTGFFGGDIGRVIEALAAFEFIEPSGAVFRVRGADKYLRINGAQRAAGKASAGNLRRGGELQSSPPPSRDPSRDPTSGSTRDPTRNDFPALSPNTEHRTPIEATSTVELALDLGLTAGPDAPRKTPPERLEAELPDDAFQVWEHWRQTLGHPKAKLDPKRQRLIVERLRAYTVAELQSAIDGCKRSPHHMGENDRRTRYDDIELILRDAKHVEMFQAVPR